MPDVVLRTSATTTGTTPSNTTRTVAVEHDDHWRLKARIAAANPSTGVFQGSAEIVLEELDAANAVTQTVVGTLSSVGVLTVKVLIHKSSSTGLPGGAIKWLSTTTRARILVRYAGTNKNLTIRIGYRELIKGAHEPRHRKKRFEDFFPGDTTTPVDPPPVDPPPDQPPDDDTELPPGDDAGVDPPPEEPLPPEPIPAVSPALIAVDAPDRPPATGTALETKHTFESGFPAGWDQIISGATLTRDATSQLTGTYSLRSYKATP